MDIDDTILNDQKLNENVCSKLDFKDSSFNMNESLMNVEDPKQTQSLYYGVHIPSDILTQDNEGGPIVLQDKMEALKAVKKYKKARFKCFYDYYEAADFAMYGSENPNNNSTMDESLSQKTVQESANSNIGEKPSQFRGPKSQDLVKLRKGIETGDLVFVRNTIWENPRYLVSVGDTPSILQEGSRYNALHVAAKAKNVAMCELILNTISDINFIKYLYGEDSYQDPVNRAKILLDLYLNTPDKGLNETPLHFAVKFGALQVVEFLVSFPQCDRTLKNKFGLTPSEIICDRAEGCDLTSVKKKIALLLQDNYYVPVLRSEDNCMPPVIGEPFSPTSPPTSFANSLPNDPLTPRLEIHAYAGPMNKTEAEKFRKVWKTPPRSISSSTSKKFANTTLDNTSTLIRKDHEKGLERVGQNLATKYSVGWKEYWRFLESFVDLASTEGLQQLEIYLSNRFKKEYSTSSSNSHSPVQKSGINSPKNISPTEVTSPMSDLCNALKALILRDNNSKIRSNMRTELFNDKLQELNPEQIFSSVDLNPFLCVEKACQVFAQRISKDILYLLEIKSNATSILESQIKQLQLLISSYMEDIRFISVDFHLIHSRLSSLITNKLINMTEDKGNIKKMHNQIQNWAESCRKHLDCFSSDDESANNRQNSVNHEKTTSKNMQVLCVLLFILNNLNNLNKVINDKCNTEDECMKEWGEAKPCRCNLQSRGIRKNSTIKRSSRLKSSVKRLFSFSTENYTSQDAEMPKMMSTEDEKNTAEKENEKPQIYEENSNDKVDDDSSSDDEYFTPPSSPPLLEISSDEEIFDETRLPDVEVFIEGDIPTKIDCAVYNALQLADCKLNPKDYPNIYRWQHNVSLYSENERESWTHPSIGRCTLGSPTLTSIPSKESHSQPKPFITSPRSWIRITGTNSPRAVLKSVQGNINFNL